MDEFDEQTTIRELRAEVEFWKGRAHILSSAVTAMSAQIAAQSPKAVDAPAAPQP